MSQNLEAMKETITQALRAVLGQRKEAIRERILSCLADHVEQELNDLAEPPALDDALFSELSGTMQHDGAMAAPSTPPNYTALAGATRKLAGCVNQVAILESLIEGAARFSSRSAVFVCRNGQALGWEQSGFAANAYSMAIRGACLPLADNSALARVVSSGRCLSSGDAGLGAPVWKAIGAEPSTSFTAVPLTVRGRIAAVLFADPGDGTGRVQAEALEILARVAEMSLETMTLRAEKSSPSGAATSPQAEGAPAPQASLAAMQQSAPAPPPTMMPPAAMESMAPMEAPVVPPAFTADLVSEGADEMAGEDEISGPARDPEEGELHEEARRFARLLVSEIVLYNPDAVQEGREQRNLGERLREDLERSEKMYRKRVAPEVAEETDYFHEEVVRTLAGGDPSLMGQ